MVERDQFKILVKAMKAVYTKPDFLPDQDAFNVWYMMLRDLSYDVLTNAVQKHMMTSPFPPTIADLRAAASQFMPTGSETELTELEAWELVRRALSNSGYHADEEYEKLPKLVQRAVGNPANLREWAMMDMDTVNSVEQSHFIRAYRTVVEREKDMLKLSPVMRQLIDKVSSGMALEDAMKDREAITSEQALQNTG